MTGLEPRPVARRSGDGAPGPQPQDCRPGATEQILSAVWSGILGIAELDREDNFFDLGGDSITATRLAAAARSAGISVTIEDVFLHQTVARMAMAHDNAETGTTSTTQTLADAARRPPVTRRAWAGQIRPLSFAQTRLWVVSQLEGQSATYNIPLLIRLRGQVDGELLRAAVRDVVVRHESLRTVIGEDGEEPVQLVLEPGQVGDVVEAVPVEEEERDARIGAAVGYIFDLVTEIPVKGWLLAQGEGEWVLVLVLHHIAADGWSMGPLLRDLGHAYAARISGTNPQWDPLPVQYADYAVWQRERLGAEKDFSGLRSAQLAYWRERLAGVPEELALPVNRPRPMVASYCGKQVAFEVGAELCLRLRRVAADATATLYMVFAAALAVLLTRLGAGTDIPIGSVVAGRGDEALDDLVGFFVNTIVLRTDTSGDPSVRELLDRVRRIVLEAQSNQELPFDQLVGTLNPSRFPGRNPLFQVMLTYREEEMSALDLPGVTSVIEDPGESYAKFDLTLSVVEPAHRDEGVGLRCAWTYATDLFDRVTVVALSQQFEQLLEQFAANPDLLIIRAALPRQSTGGSVPGAVHGYESWHS